MTTAAATRPPGTDVLLTVRDLTVGYPGKPVLGGLQVTIRAGECVALVGANGSGKTTLLRTLLGILPPLAGEIRRGRDGAGLALGYVPQRDEADAVVPLTVAEVVRMGAYRRWRPFLPLASTRRERVAAALAKVRADGWEGRAYGELSGGQRQRVLIARALMAEPALVLLDEPTTGIDLESEEAIYAELGRSCAAGLGVLMVSHDLGGMVRVATRALVIQNGGLTELPVGELLVPDRMRTLLGGSAARE